MSNQAEEQYRESCSQLHKQLFARTRDGITPQLKCEILNKISTLANTNKSYTVLYLQHPPTSGTMFFEVSQKINLKQLATEIVRENPMLKWEDAQDCGVRILF